MSKALPRKYFPGYTAHISFRKVNRYAEQWKATRPYFDTWYEAWAFMLERAAKEKDRAEKALASAKRHLEKVKAMRPKV